MTEALLQSDLDGLAPPKRGKVRDVYDLGDELLIVASDRISAYDHVLKPGIPGKGKILTQLSNFWFERLAKISPHHLLATNPRDFPASLAPHADVLAGMSDKQAELALLQNFIPQAPGTDFYRKLIAAWRRGDADAITRMSHEMQRDLPTFTQRLIAERNQNWIPKIERYLHDRRTYFVVAGAAHMGGANGVLALLKARGCRIEQL